MVVDRVTSVEDRAIPFSKIDWKTQLPGMLKIFGEELAHNAYQGVEIRRHMVTPLTPNLALTVDGTDWAFGEGLNIIRYFFGL